MLVLGLAVAPRGATSVILTARPTRAIPSVEKQPSVVDPCGPSMFPDNGVCVHLEPEEESDAPAYQNAHRERSGKWVLYDQIPRRPDRPSDYDAYEYPVPPGAPGGHSVISGYDLDRPDESQRRGRTLHAVGHGGVDLPQARGTPVAMIMLDHQEGDAEVVYAGPLFGTTVVTRHTLREGGGLREYILLFGHLDSIARGVTKGVTLRVGDVVGAVGDTGSPELVHLHLEVRRVREKIDVGTVEGVALLGPEITIVCDPRNVLPLRAGGPTTPPSR
jgi:murein DD-endopeptidase MepM/ murein hydrolase activator NlpD